MGRSHEALETVGVSPSAAAPHTHDAPLASNDAKVLGCVNRRLVVPKVCYFFVFSALSAYTPYLPVFMQRVGLTAAETGFLRLLMPVVGLLGQPLWAGCADSWSLHRRILLSTMGVGTLLRCCIAFAAAVSGDDADLKGSTNHADAAADSSGEGLGADGGFSGSSQFWFCFFAVCASESVASPFVALIDSSVLGLLGPDKLSYGKQRLWGAVGWGIFSAVTGGIIQLTSILAMFVVHPAMMTVAFMMVSRLKVQSRPLTGSWIRGVMSLFSSIDVALFLLATVMLGMLAGVIGSFLFIFLETIGGSTLLMGLSLTVTCTAEAPIFFFAGKIIDRFGELPVIGFAFVCFGLRFWGYSSLHNPWWVLPIEILHGVTFGAAWASCTNFARTIAPVGLEATTQAILTALKMGLGIGMGSFFGGLVYQAHGPRVLFRSCMWVALAGLGVTCLAIFVRRRRVGPAQALKGLASSTGRRTVARASLRAVSKPVASGEDEADIQDSDEEQRAARIATEGGILVGVLQSDALGRDVDAGELAALVSHKTVDGAGFEMPGLSGGAGCGSSGRRHGGPKRSGPRSAREGGYDGSLGPSPSPPRSHASVSVGSGSPATGGSPLQGAGDVATLAGARARQLSRQHAAYSAVLLPEADESFPGNDSDDEICLSDTDSPTAGASGTREGRFHQGHGSNAHRSSHSRSGEARILDAGDDHLDGGFGIAAEDEDGGFVDSSDSDNDLTFDDVQNVGIHQLSP